MVVWEARIGEKKMKIDKIMYVIRENHTNRFKRNNGFFRDINEECASAIKLYESSVLAKSAIRQYDAELFAILPVLVSMDIQNV